MNDTDTSVPDILSGGSNEGFQSKTREQWHSDAILGRRSISLSLHVVGGIIIATILLTCCCTICVRKKCARIINKLTWRKKKESVWDLCVPLQILSLIPRYNEIWENDWLVLTRNIRLGNIFLLISRKDERSEWKNCGEKRKGFFRQNWCRRRSPRRSSPKNGRYRKMDRRPLVTNVTEKRREDPRDRYDDI